MRLFYLLSLAVTACASIPQGEPAAPGITYLVCGSAIRLDVSHDGRTASLRLGDGQVTELRRVESPLGTRYEGDGLAVMRSGDTYIFTDRDGTTTSCDPLPR